MGFPDNVKTLRKQSGMSQTEVAQKLGIPQTTFSDLERGKYEPTISVAKRIAELFRVKLDWLIAERK